MRLKHIPRITSKFNINLKGKKILIPSPMLKSNEGIIEYIYLFCVHRFKIILVSELGYTLLTSYIFPEVSFHWPVSLESPGC